MTFLQIFSILSFVEATLAFWEWEEGSSQKKVSLLYRKYLNSLETLIRQKRKLLQWESNPMPLVCQMSALDH